jgi:hypothetical protein
MKVNIEIGQPKTVLFHVHVPHVASGSKHFQTTQLGV